MYDLVEFLSVPFCYALVVFTRLSLEYLVIDDVFGEGVIEMFTVLPLIHREFYRLHKRVYKMNNIC